MAELAVILSMFYWYEEEEEGRKDQSSDSLVSCCVHFKSLVILHLLSFLLYFFFLSSSQNDQAFLPGEKQTLVVLFYFSFSIESHFRSKGEWSSCGSCWVIKRNLYNLFSRRLTTREKNINGSHTYTFVSVISIHSLPLNGVIARSSPTHTWRKQGANKGNETQWHSNNNSKWMG